MKSAAIISILRKCRIFVLLILALAMTGCSFVTTYNLAYVPSTENKAQEPVAGKGLIYTEKADDLNLFSGNPTSFTGSASTLTIPLGAITKGIAEIVFRNMFKDGFESSNSLENASQYRAVITPRTTRFTYEYNQLKNAGFAITPTVQITLEVKLLRPDGKPFWEKSYDSGVQEGPAYMISGSPGEEISKLTHGTIYTLMTQAASDVRSVLASRSAKRD